MTMTVAEAHALIDTLIQARKAIGDAQQAVATLNARIEKREGGLLHVMHQLQNADLLAMFIERSWRRIAGLEQEVL